ncbi:MAG: lysophospholipid acyltransferase family protein [Chloroflexota bacterium]|nr:lysophospholipid acyltransferase family protein [Chloroflexota bacterium]
MRSTPEPLARCAVEIIADVLWLLQPSVRRLVTSNIGRACRVADLRTIRRCARRSWRGLVTNYYELLLAGTWTAAEVRERVRLSGAEDVDRARSAGRGVIVMFVHAGPFEALSALARLRPEWMLATLVERMRDPRTHALMHDIRERSGLYVIPVDRLRHAVRHVLNGAVLLIGADRDATRSGLSVELFGVPAHLPDGAVQLALRLDAPLFLAHAVRGPGRRPHYDAVVRPITVQRTPDRQADVLRAVQATARAIEEIIAADPDQWVANYDFWADA